MKAIMRKDYGSPDILEFAEDVPIPVPKPNEILIKIHSAAMNALDWHFLRGEPYFMRLAMGCCGPSSTILGAEFAGVIIGIGEEVIDFKIGEEVFGGTDFMGAFAEYICVSHSAVSAVIHKPVGLSFDDASTLSAAGLTALQGLRDHAHLRPGQQVLINGASGGVGTFAVQIAKYYETEVTAICSTDNVENVRLLGADHVIDYKQEDFTQNGKLYDVIFDVAANRSFSENKAALKPEGIYVQCGFSISLMMQCIFFGSCICGKTMSKPWVAEINKNDLVLLAELVVTGSIKPFIDRRYSLNEVADAMRYMEAGHARGKVVISVV